MLVQYYLSDDIKVSFEDFALGLRNAWAGPVRGHGIDFNDISLFALHC